MTRMINIVMVLALTLGLPGVGTGEPLALIVNLKSGVTDLSRKHVAHIYQGKKKTWPNGQQIVVTNRPVGSPDRQRFYQVVLEVPETQKFYRRGSPLPVKTMPLKSARACVRYVSKVPGAIGYVPLSAVTKSVQVITLNGLSPKDDAYLLK